MGGEKNIHKLIIGLLRNEHLILFSKKEMSLSDARTDKLHKFYDSKIIIRGKRKRLLSVHSYIYERELFTVDSFSLKSVSYELMHCSNCCSVDERKSN